MVLADKLSYIPELPSLGRARRFDTDDMILILQYIYFMLWVLTGVSTFITTLLLTITSNLNVSIYLF